MLYIQNQELADLGNSIIAQHRPGLVEVKICYMFRETASITQDRAIAGRCIRVDDRNWAIHKFDFLIEIAQDVWNEASGDFRRALMDHELGHIGIARDEEGDLTKTEDGRVKTLSKMHDVEEFTDVLERHGAYHKMLREFLAAFAARKRKKKKGAEDDGEEDAEETTDD